MFAFYTLYIVTSVPAHTHTHTHTHWVASTKNVYATFIQRNLNILWMKFDLPAPAPSLSLSLSPLVSGTFTKNFCIWKLISFGVMPCLCMPVCASVCVCKHWSFCCPTILTVVKRIKTKAIRTSPTSYPPPPLLATPLLKCFSYIFW